MNATANHMNSHASMSDAAIAYAKQGFYVLPLWWPTKGECACPDGRDCGRNTAKHPTTRNGLKDATTDERVIRSWWKRWPQANIGIALEPSGLIALDVDTPEAYATLAEIERRHGELATARQRSGSGNLHVLARRPPFDIRGSYNGITLRGRNYIVAAPSVHASGGIYEWIDAPWDVEPIELPAPVADLFRRRSTTAAETKTTQVDNETQMKRAKGWLAKAEPAIEGQHGQSALFKVCCRLVHGFKLTDSDALSAIVDSYNPRCIPPWSDDEIGEIERKIKEARSKCDSPGNFVVEDRPAPNRSDREPDREAEDDPIPDEARADTVDPDESAAFVTNDKGAILTTQSNVRLALRKLGVSVSVDEFARQEMISGLPSFGPRLDDNALRELRLVIDERFTFRIAKETFDDFITRHAWRNRYHPVRSYLDGLAWDGKDRIDQWLVDAGAPDTPYVRAVSRLVLIAAVRRVRSPGAKYDEMLILESKQGTNKSTALKTLVPEESWFSDDLPLDGDTKKLIEQTGGKWIVEAGELKGMSRSDVTTLKATLSRTVDEARLAYGRKPTIAARQFVIIGTTNETGDYLRDGTGNRRFWPVAVQRFDLHKLRADRDQLWAEAAARERDGASIRLDPSLYKAAADEQANREADDPIEAVLARHLAERTGRIYTEAVLELLGIEPGKATTDQNTRVGAAMRRLGWERTRRRHNGGRVYAYQRGDSEDEISVDVDISGGKRRVHVTGGRS